MTVSEIQIVLADPKAPSWQSLPWHAGMRVRDALVACTFYLQLTTDERAQLGISIFSRPCVQDTLLHPGDRIELCRPLQISPKEARRLRAARKKHVHSEHSFAV